MNYQTFEPHKDLAALVKCYWSLEVPAESLPPKQRIIPDGCIEMIFILGEDVKRFTSETDFLIQPRAMILGQITEAFYIQPTGYVNTFAVRFYPYGFANFVTQPISELSNKETPLEHLFSKESSTKLEREIMLSADTSNRIKIIETFLLGRLTHLSTVKTIVETTIEALILTTGKRSIRSVVNYDLAKRKHLERKFSRQVGISPKQLGKIIRLQAALKMLLNHQSGRLTDIAYENEYYDQAHFIRDFKEFTGTTPTGFMSDENLALSALIYKKG